MERGLDWLLQLPDPREEGAAEPDVNSSSGLRPLRASSSQPRLPSRGGQPAGPANAAAARRPVGGCAAHSTSGATAATRAARRPGSASQQNASASKLNRPAHPLGLGGMLGADGGAHANGMFGGSGTSAAAAAAMAARRQAKAVAQGAGMAPGIAPPGAQSRALGHSATESSMLVRKQLLRTQSGLLPPKGASLGVSTSMAGGLTRGGLSRCSSTGVLTPYNAQTPHQGGSGAGFSGNSSLAASKRLTSGSSAAPGSTSSGRASESGRGRGASEANDGFRSEALQLEVRLAEGLQALQDAEATEGEDGTSQAASRRLQLCRTLFERIIERDAPFGHLLQRVKREYEAALQAVRAASLQDPYHRCLCLTNGRARVTWQSAPPSDSELERCHSELTSTRRLLTQSQQSAKVLEEENAQLRAQVAKLAEREAALREEVSATTLPRRSCERRAFRSPTSATLPDRRLRSLMRHSPPSLAATTPPNLSTGRLPHRCARSRSTLTTCNSTRCSRRRPSRLR